MAAMARPSFSHLDEADKIQMEKDRKGPANYDDDEEEEYKTTFKRRESERAIAARMRSHVRQLRHHFRPFLGHLSAPPPRPLPYIM